MLYSSTRGDLSGNLLYSVSHKLDIIATNHEPVKEQNRSVVKRVLVIDDEADIREMVQASLKIMAKLDVILASSSRDGLRLAADQKPDAILLDVLMPELDGLAVFQQLQASPDTQDIPVVFLTAKTQLSEQQRILHLGAKGIITKPFKPVALAKQLQEILGWSH